MSEARYLVGDVFERIDLDSRNLDLARQRCGMFLHEDEVPVWPRSL